ncbi:MAG: helix-turn-helix domain-containing protein [Parvularculaceae bacterium]
MRDVRKDDGFSELYKQKIAAAALEVMAEAYNVPLSRLTMASRQKAHIAFARQMAMYLAHVVGQLSLRDVAGAFEREPSTVSYACHAIEDRRDSPIFDKQMAFLETTLRERVEGAARVEAAFADDGAPTLRSGRQGLAAV